VLAAIDSRSLSGAVNPISFVQSMFCSNISWHKTTERKGLFSFLFATAFPWFLVSLYEYLWGGAAVLGVISSCGSASERSAAEKWSVA